MSERENDASSLTSPRPRITTRQEELGSNSLTNLKKYNIHRLAPIALYPPAKARGFTASLIKLYLFYINSRKKSISQQKIQPLIKLYSIKINKLRCKIFHLRMRSADNIYKELYYYIIYIYIS